MFHMISCFNLKPGEDIERFRTAYTAFVEEMKAIDLVETTGPIGRRQSDTPMDTDEERDHEYFVILNFRDRQQVDDSYDHIMAHIGATDTSHQRVIEPVLDPVFICWQDLPA